MKNILYKIIFLKIGTNSLQIIIRNKIYKYFLKKIQKKFNRSIFFNNDIRNKTHMFIILKYLD